MHVCYSAYSIVIKLFFVDSNSRLVLFVSFSDRDNESSGTLVTRISKACLALINDVYCTKLTNRAHANIGHQWIH